MNRVSIPYTTEADWLAHRCQDLTSTDIAALFSLSPYKTAFELWHEKKAGECVELTENERMLWGNRLQDAIADGIAQDLGLIIRPMREYIRLADLRVASSFDFAIEGVRDDSPFRARFETDGPGILEIKNVDWLAFRNGWTVEDNFIEAPAHIEVQTQHQQLVSARRWSLIGAFVGGNRYETLERLADDSVHRGILAAAHAFWASIDANTPPDPVMPDDADAVIRMHQYAEPGKLFDARKDAHVASLVQQYHQLGTVEKQAEEDRKVIKAEILQAIGDAEKILIDGFSVSCGLVGPSAGTLVTADMVGKTIGGRAGYRLFRCVAKKAAARAAE